MPHKRVAIVQSSYIPWKGYFDLIRAVDEFVLFDDVQFTKRDWRSRNRIKTPHGPQWLTVPVMVKGRYSQRIRDAVIDDVQWTEQHWQRIRSAYGRAPFFRDIGPAVERLYATATDEHLSRVNNHLLSGLCRLLSIDTPLTWSSDYALEDGRTTRLVSICRQAGATEYISGPAARAYLDPAEFTAAGITLTYADYDSYPEYPQFHPPFEHAVTVIDLLMHTGPEAPRYLKNVAPRVTE